MSFDLKEWKEKTTTPLQKVGQWLDRGKKAGAPRLLYGYLCGLSLWPLVAAAQTTDSPLMAMTVLGSVAGSVGGNLIANQIQKWVYRKEPVSKEEIEQWVTENANNQELLQALDNILDKLDIIPQAQVGLNESQQQQFAQLLRQELTRLGNLTRFEAKIVGIGAVAQGQNSVAVTAVDRGIAVGKTGGDVNITTIQPSKSGINSTDLRQAYLNRLLTSASRLSLAGIDPQAASRSQAEAGLDLSAVYTALLTVSQEHQDSPEREASGREPRRLSALAQLNKHSRLVLLGDPGSGKSTFVNFAAMCLAGELLGNPQANLKLLTAPLPDDEGQDQAEHQPWQHGPLLPVPIILREFAARGSLPPTGQKATAEHLWRFIVSQLEEAALGDYTQALGQELHRQGGLLLLDGLDEVPEADQRRVQIKQAVEDFAKTFARCRIVVTSRTYAYQKQDWRLPGFTETVLAPFSQGQIRHFIERWYSHTAALRGMHLDDARGRATVLKQAIFGSDRLRALAERPLLLTLMASLHAWRGGSLPEKREELYADAVDLMLDTWETHKVERDARGNIISTEPSLSEWLRVDREAMRGLLNQLAYQVHATQPEEAVGTADIPQGDLVSGLMALSRNEAVNPALLVRYLSQRSGLLVPHGVGVFTFPHRTFQEYLAACHLTDTDYPDLVAGLAREEPNRWREVALLAGAKAFRGTTAAIWQLVDALCYQEPAAIDAGPAAAWGALLAGRALVETANLAQVGERNRPKVKRVRQWLVHILEQGELPATERSAAGDSLAHLGDPRSGVGLRPDGLPDIAWRGVPAGPFELGEGKSKKQVELPEFRISRYPITNAQYDAFVKDGGYSEQWRQCWTQAGWANKKDQEEPRKWGGVFDLPNHPVVMITWYEAVAYCRWLTLRLQAQGGLSDKQEISLPAESQWEKAARGTDGRVYPWGNEIDPQRANYGDTGIGTSSAAGCFPGGESPYGCLDMSGNVWEWCRTKYHEPDDDSLEGDAPRVLRGGAFSNYGRDVRCAYRYGYYPSSRGGGLGFRVVLVSPFNSGL